MLRVVVAAAPPSVWMFLAQDGGSVDWLDILNRWGPWALFVLLVMVGKFVPGFLHDRVYEDNQRKDAEIRRLSDAAMEKVLPAITESNRVLLEAIDILRLVGDALKEEQLERDMRARREQR